MGPAASVPGRHGCCTPCLLDEGSHCVSWQGSGGGKLAPALQERGLDCIGVGQAGCRQHTAHGRCSAAKYADRQRENQPFDPGIVVVCHPDKRFVFKNERLCDQGGIGLWL